MKYVAAALVLLTISLALPSGYQSHAQQPLCIFTVDPRILYFEAEGGRDEVTVEPSSPGCPFEPRTACHWVTLSLSEELGRKTVIIQADAHHNLAQRVCSVMVGTTQIEVVQKARDYLSW